MGKILLAAVAATALAAGACSKQTKSTQPTGAQAKSGEAYQASSDEDAIWTDAWEGITEGAEEVGEAGEWTFEKAEDGAIVVWRGVKRVAGGARDESADAALLTAVKGRLADEKEFDVNQINVDVEEGIVTLRGEVDSGAQAAKAVRIALNTKGVDQVVSYLTWPGMRK